MAQGMDEKALKRQKYGIPTYSLAEELLNSISHGIGAGLGIAALVLCIVKSAHAGDGYKLGYWAGASIQQYQCSQMHVMGGPGDTDSQNDSMGFTGPL